MKWVGVTFNPITTMCVFLLRYGKVLSFLYRIGGDWQAIS